MSHGSHSAHAPWLRTPPPFAYATRHPDAAELRVLQAVRALAVAQPADCCVAAERVVNIAKLVSVPQRHSAMCLNVLRRSPIDARAERPARALRARRSCPPRRPPQYHDAMRRTRHFCRR